MSNLDLTLKAQEDHLDKVKYREILLSRSLILTERFLGLCDRRQGTTTLGCFDRYYWCYKVHDLANARFQEAIQYFALFQEHCHSDAQPKMVELIKDAIHYWAKLRHGDGSVDEIYPWERSFCATSMSTQAVTFAYESLALKEKVDFVDSNKKGLDIDIFRPSIILGRHKDGRTTNFKMFYQLLHFFAMELSTIQTYFTPSSSVTADVGTRRYGRNSSWQSRDETPQDE